MCKSRWTPAQLEHIFAVRATGPNVCNGFKPQRVHDNVFFGKFKNIIKLLYESKNSVSLCNDVIFNLSSRVPADVRDFVSNWLLKSLPALQAAPDDVTAFNTIIPRIVSSRAELAPYIDYLTQAVEQSQSHVSDSSTE